ncbi:MAG TPA: tetratricopeptide repeat protein [Candidatus Limnocylindrales bacterium]|nr:tetratricopeptide repeat protein [Candidatus Limnocylindrales bacterium]
MTRHYLAIPAGSFLLFFAPFVTSAQTKPDTSQSTVPASPSAAGQSQSLSDEDLARLYLVRKQYREAQEIFHKLTVQQPKNAVYWNELGISFHNQAELDPALKCYQKSGKLDPHYADAHNNMGTIYYERKKYAKAIRYYNKAIGMRGDFAPFHLNLGYAYFADKKYEEAIASFRKALQIDPDSFEAARSRVGTVIQDRSIATDRARFYFLLAKSFAESGNVDRCILYLKKARDEGYQDLNKSVNTDPSFAAVIKNPAVQDFLNDKPPDIAKP